VSPVTDPRTTSDDVAALIERIVREAHIVSAGERDALRRELADHFEDAARAGDVHDVERAVARFGSAAEVADGLRRAHRPGRRMLYAAKVSVSVVAATLVALALQLPHHLERSGGAITVAPH
jgi:hypothetical protein